MIGASALVTGVFWLTMAVTGAVSWLAALTSRPVVRGLVLGLGLSFILEGARLMGGGLALALPAAARISTGGGTWNGPRRTHGA